MRSSELADEVLDDGPSATTGKYVRPTTMTTTPMSSPANSGVSVGNVPADGGHRLLAPQRAGDRQHRDHQQEPADQHRQTPSVVLNQSVLPVEPAEGRTVVVAAEVNA